MAGVVAMKRAWAVVVSVMRWATKASLPTGPQSLVFPGFEDLGT